LSIPLTVNGAVFNYPVNFDTNWGIDATGWAQAVTAGMLQKAGGTFPLAADVNFGASFGVISPYFTSHAANPATVGTLRLASIDPGVVFRNNANSGNLVLTTDASDNLLYNGHILNGSGASPVLSIIGTTNQVIASSPTGNVTLSLPQSIAPASSPSFAGVTLSAPSFVQNATSIGFQDTGSLHTIALQAPGTTATYALTLPPNAGSSGQVLQTDGAGVTTWVNAAGGGTVNTGTAGNIAFYATTSNIISDGVLAKSNIFLADGSVSATGNFNMGSSHKIINLAPASSPQDAVSFVQLSNGGAITAGGIANNTITATQIANATITTTQVASNTLTGSTANSGGSAGNVAQGTISTSDFRANAVTQKITGSTSVTLTTIGGYVVVSAQIDESVTTATGIAGFVGYDISFSIVRDGSTTVYSARQANGGLVTGKNCVVSFAGSAIDTPSASSHTYVASVSVAVGTDNGAINTTAYATEFRA
jgi:hypothetical protein